MGAQILGLVRNDVRVSAPPADSASDAYWRVGLPLELLVIAIAIPMLLWRWPL